MAKFFVPTHYFFFPVAVKNRCPVVSLSINTIARAIHARGLTTNLPSPYSQTQVSPTILYFHYFTSLPICRILFFHKLLFHLMYRISKELNKCRYDRWCNQVYKCLTAK